MNILAMLYSTIFLCLAMPELPPETVTALQEVQGSAYNYSLAEQGVNTQANNASLFLLFNGLYRGLQAWNEWNGGDDYIIQKQYVMERTDLPAWLAEYSGDAIFWELEYFGHTIEMITDKDGKILVNPQKGKALNVRIKDEMRQASAKFKAENVGDYKNVPVPQIQTNTKVPAIPNLQSPYIQGNDLYFSVYIGGQKIDFRVNDFRNTYYNVSKWNNLYRIGFLRENQTYPSITCLTQGYNPVIWTDVGSLKDVSTDSWIFQSKTCISLRIETSAQFDMNLPFYYFYTNSGAPTFYKTNLAQYSGIVNNSAVLARGSQIFLAGENVGKVINTSYLPSLVGVSVSGEELQNITNMISEIIPETDPDTGIEIFPIPENIPLPEEVPLSPEEGPIPDGPVYPEFDFPIGDPEQVPESDPGTAPTTEPTEISLPENAEEIPLPENLPIVNGLQNRFPFSIPWDIYNALSNLSGERQIPHWEWTLNVNMPFSEEVFSYTFVLDLGFMAGTVGLFRNLFLLAFILGLAVYSYNKFFGGGA